MSQLDFDLASKFRVSAGDAYVGYESTEGDDIAVQIFEDNVHHGDGIALKSKNVKQEGKFDGYEGAIAGGMTALAAGAYLYFKKRETKTVSNDAEFALV